MAQHSIVSQMELQGGQGRGGEVEIRPADLVLSMENTLARL